MTTTAIRSAAPSTPLVKRDDTHPRQDWLAPDDGSVRMPCGDSIPDTLDATSAHVAECHDCAVVVYA